MLFQSIAAQKYGSRSAACRVSRARPNCLRNLNALFMGGRPFAGAWIETRRSTDAARHHRRRPFAGAWIETSNSSRTQASEPVAPSRGRGSKQRLPAPLPALGRSPLRGGVDRNFEMVGDGRMPQPSPLRGGVDRNKEHRLAWFMTTGSPLRGGVDRNDKWEGPKGERRRSPLRGGVDRNYDPRRGVSSFAGRPFAGAWIETTAPGAGNIVPLVAPSRGRGSKRVTRSACLGRKSSPLRGGVDRNA